MAAARSTWSLTRPSPKLLCARKKNCRKPLTGPANNGPHANRHQRLFIRGTRSRPLRTAPRATAASLALSHLSTLTPHPRLHCLQRPTSHAVLRNSQLRSGSPPQFYSSRVRILRTTQRAFTPSPWTDSSLLFFEIPEVLLPDFSRSFKASCVVKLYSATRSLVCIWKVAPLHQLRPISKILNTLLNRPVSRHCDFPLTLITYSRGLETPVPEVFQPTSRSVDTRFCFGRTTASLEELV